MNDDDVWIIQNIFDDDDIIPGPGAAPAAGPVAQGAIKRKRKRKHKSSKAKGKSFKRRRTSKRRKSSKRRY